jgi:nucleoside 2-deoxyribosyltransferase
MKIWNYGIMERFENLTVLLSTFPSFQYSLSAAWQAIQKFKNIILRLFYQNSSIYRVLKILINTADIIIAVAGGAGTLSEISFAWQMQKPIIAYPGFGG